MLASPLETHTISFSPSARPGSSPPLTFDMAYLGGVCPPLCSFGFSCAWAANPPMIGNWALLSSISPAFILSPTPKACTTNKFSFRENGGTEPGEVSSFCSTEGRISATGVLDSPQQALCWGAVSTSPYSATPSVFPMPQTGWLGSLETLAWLLLLWLTHKHLLSQGQKGWGSLEVTLVIQHSILGWWI